MKNLLLIEYFTSKSNLDLRRDKEFVREGLNILNSIIKNFLKSKYIKNINLIINKKIKIIKSKKINYFFTSNSISYIDILNKFDLKNKAILIAPEIDKISLEFHSVLRKKCIILGSDQISLETFSSKFQTSKILSKFDIPAVKSYKNNPNIKKNFIFKPDYGAGSSNVKIMKQNKIEENYITQKFHSGKKGSFLMLCKNGKSKVICCNEQIINIKKQNIRQIGCVIGGLERDREEIEILGSNICKKFNGLFGIVGVDIVKNKKKWLVLEINPRFTSAYCGLQASYSNSTISLITDFYLTGEIKSSPTTLLKSSKYIF